MQIKEMRIIADRMGEWKKYLLLSAKEKGGRKEAP